MGCCSEKCCLENRIDLNMKNYDETYKNFDWNEIEKEFTWHKTGKVNMAYEAIDKHAKWYSKNKVALHYVDDNREEKYTYKDLKSLSNKFGNVLKNLGIKKGDRVFVFLPRSPELYISSMGITKIGGIVGPLFEAFMEGAVKDRLYDSGAVAVITTPELRKRIKKEDLPALEHIITVGSNGSLGKCEISYEAEMKKASSKLDITWLSREDPLILHYTSGSTGKPKGVLHAQNAMMGHYITAKYVLDLKKDDTLWCTADPGWVTGTSYGMYGPLLNGCTTLIRGGRFDTEKWYKTLQDKKVTVWFSAPTAFRMMMAAGDDLVKKYDLKSVRNIYSVGEPLNPEVIRWGEEVFNKTIMENWWMTETGMMLIANYPCLEVKPGSMGKPFPGIIATIIDEKGNELPPNQIGQLAIKAGWPSMMRKIWNNSKKYEEYFAFKPWYVSGDSAYKDDKGYFWFQGRIDDVIKTSGERVGPFEVESKLVEHPAIAEAGVIGKPDPLRGEIIKAFISLRKGYTPSKELEEEIKQFVKKGLAAHAAPREIEFKDKLPKTKSGKIMRRVLKAWELGLPTGDLSTMED
ncbi:acetate--CoA ligase [Candidatus Woesearchaeota archaeon]|nr:acetate--CoA ligase [Candidatus Woesearchaeota archaeon]